MRWNNYGIGLLDAQQYAESARAFERVAAMRPDYADAFTNVAIADFQWERYDAARGSLEKALQLAPHNARALYYLALVERTQGNLEAAISDLREVTAQFPRSRDAHRELGFSLYQQHKYDEARTEYETLQSIDPDDLAAHYILSIVYRRLGMKEQAAREASAFADQKDDPTASTYALEFLRKHPEITSESVPWHTHSDLAAQPAAGGERVLNEVVVTGPCPCSGLLTRVLCVFAQPARARRVGFCRKRMHALPHHSQCRRPQGSGSLRRRQKVERSPDAPADRGRQQGDAVFQR